MELKIPFQDHDLLARLTHYLENIDSHLAKGHGWLIFNADAQRTHRIVGYLLDHFTRQEPRIRYHLVPWRDFAVHAYVLKVELVAQAAEDPRGEENPKLRREHDIANRISLDINWQMQDESILLITGVTPKNRYEAEHMVAVVDYRFTNRHSTVVITPKSIEQLASDFRSVGAPDGWASIYNQMYETSFIAL